MIDRMSRGEARWNAWLSAALLLAIVVVGNQLAREHLIVRRDFSEDQLYAVSPATRRILGRLEDKLLVKAYFSSDIQSGEMAIAKARLEAQLEELSALAAGRMDIVYVDPLASTEHALDAESFGITSRRIESQQGLQRIAQHVYFGALLRYRGREAALPFLNPWTFETEFGTSVHGLVRDKRTVVGWFGEEPDPATDEAAYGTFRGARQLLARRFDVRLVDDLASGEAVSEEIDLLIVARPIRLHARATFEIDQFVQRGGKLVVLVDQARVNPYTGAREDGDRDVHPTGLDVLLRAWGAPPTPQHVWDDLWKTTHGAPRLEDMGNGQVRAVSIRVQSPLVITVPEDGFDRELPPTANLQEASFSWAQPIFAADLPGGVERTPLITSSERAYRTKITALFDTDQGRIDAKTIAEYAGGSGMRYSLAVALRGRFPSIFEGGAPAPWDPFVATPDPQEPQTTDEDVLSRAAESVVVVFGDADWIRDPVRPLDLYPFFTRGNQKLFLNVIDWLSLDKELIDLRSREPRMRALADFVEEEKRERGLFSDTIPDSQEELERNLKLETEALRAARARQWLHMLLPTLGTLVLVLGFGLVWFVTQRGGRP
ncbi:MAG: GldG family protein [bacterium]|nr:GldG family protein [bacterium]